MYFKAIEIALANADEVVLVGENAAREGRKLFDKSRLGIHETQREAADYLRASLRQDELILLKSARNLHLERLIMALEQDVKCWKNQCKIRYSCPVCGLWPEAPEDHARILRHREFARLLGPLARFMPAHR